MAKQHFDTKVQQNIRKQNTILLLIISIIGLVFFIYMFIDIINSDIFDTDAKNSVEYTKVCILFGILTIEVYLFTLFPILAVLFGIQRGRSKGYKSNATFDNNTGITYYRDFLKDVNPSSMSIIMDLQIESNKDIAATLLRLYDKKAIQFIQRQIICTDNTTFTTNLDNSEQELLELIRSNKLNMVNISTWKKNRIQDAISEGYVDNSNKKISLGKVIARFFLTILFNGLVSSFIFIIFVFFAYKYDLTEFIIVALKIEKGISIDKDELKIIVDCLKIIVGLLAFSNIISAFPYYSLFKYIAYSGIKMKSQLVRTQKGNEAAEKIAGLQRFIHEFSNLSESQKEQMILWNDFLVYAVVLEENELIVKDIGRFYNKIDIVNILHSFKAM